MYDFLLWALRRVFPDTRTSLGLVSLALMMLTIRAAVFRHNIETAVLVLPVATMIAFAQLRASMPNAPAGFGEPRYPPNLGR